MVTGFIYLQRNFWLALAFISPKYLSYRSSYRLCFLYKDVLLDNEAMTLALKLFDEVCFSSSIKQFYTHDLDRYVSHPKCGHITTYDNCNVRWSHTLGVLYFLANLVQTSKAQVCLLQVDTLLYSFDSHNFLLVNMIDTSIAGKIKPNVQQGIWLQLQIRADSSSQLMETK